MLVVMVVMMVQHVVKIQGSSTPPGNISNLTYCNSEPGSSSYSNIDEVKLFGDNYNIDNNTIWYM